MSLRARQVLATAASRVNGVTVSPYFRQTTQPGQGFVRLDVSNAAANGFGFMCSWQVCIVLANTQASAEEWIDAHLAPLQERLGNEGVVTSCRPVQLAVDSGILPALVITVIREQE